MNNGKTREQILTAFFTLLQGTVGIKTFSRRYKHWKEISSAEKPYMILMEAPEDVMRPSESHPAKITLNPQVLIYINVGADPNSTPTIDMNNLLDAVDTALLPPATQQNQTLGGLVSHCWIEGKVEKVPGDLDGDGVAMLPFKILVP